MFVVAGISEVGVAVEMVGVGVSVRDAHGCGVRAVEVAGTLTSKSWKSVVITGKEVRDNSIMAIFVCGCPLSHALIATAGTAIGANRAAT